MKTLSLLRHAKSSWSDPHLADARRPLNGRGRRAATAIGRWIAASGHLPDEVVCSPSERTRETLIRAARAWPGEPPTRFEPSLYHADLEALLAVARRAGDADHRMLVAHHPGVQELALALSSEGDPAELGALQARFPTGALAVVAVRVSRWEDLALGAGRLVAFVRPRDLALD